MRGKKERKEEDEIHSHKQRIKKNSVLKEIQTLDIQIVRARHLPAALFEVLFIGK